MTAEEKFREILLPVVVEALETLGRETNGGGSGKVEIARVEKIEERVLKHLGPDLEVFEVGTTRSEATNDSVGNVTDT